MADLTLAANNGDIGGGEVMLLQMADLARDLGLDVQIVAPDRSPVLEHAHADGFVTCGIQSDSRQRYMASLRRWDAHERTGLLWCHGLVPALATAGHRRRVVHLHQLPERLKATASRLAAMGADRVVVPSVFMQSQLPGTRVFPNWTSPFVSNRHQRQDAAVIGYLGRLSPDKGTVVLAKALEILNAQRPGHVRLLMAGEPRFVSEAEHRRTEEALARVAPLVERRGWVDRSSFFSAVDLAVFPSVADEAFGLVVAEAMSAGVPFVISDAGALPEVAGHSHPWIARRDDPEDLARAIAGALNADPSTVTAAARRRWETCYSPDAAREHLRALLAELGVPTKEQTRDQS